MSNNYYVNSGIEKSLHIFPLDLTTMFKSDGSLNTRLLKRKARMLLNNSTPIINSVITDQKNVMSVSADNTKTFQKHTQLNDHKSIYVEASFTEAEIAAVTDADSLKDLINSKNNLFYLASAISTFSENVVDIYYSKSEKCLVVAPELSLLGSVLPANEFLLDIAGWKVGLLNIQGLQTDFNFSKDVRYRPLPDLTITDSATHIAESRTDVSVHSILLQGLATFPYISEYMRKTGNGDVNMLKDTPVQIIVLEEDTVNMLAGNKFDHHFVVQNTPFTYKLHQINDVECKKIAFPIFF